MVNTYGEYKILLNTECNETVLLNPKKKREIKRNAYKHLHEAVEFKSQAREPAERKRKNYVQWRNERRKQEMERNK